jgi:Lipase (class 3)
VAAVRAVRKILSSVDDHGVIDVFAKYRKQDVLLSICALSRLQDAVAVHERRQHTFPEVDDKVLLEDLAHYAVYASVVYGWKMHLAFGGGLHLGDLQVLLRRTGISRDDLLAHEKESKAHRPAYFIVRDQAKRNIVLCIRGTWSAHDILTDLCCVPKTYDLPSRRRSTNETESEYFSITSGPLHDSICAHQGMLQAANLLRKDVETLIREELKANPGLSLVLVGHSLGGGVAAILGTLWDGIFPNLKVYIYGAPCVSTIQTLPTGSRNIVSVISDGDPFRSFSLGHVADVSIALSLLCKDPDFRSLILIKTDCRSTSMDPDELEWCIAAIKRLRVGMNSPKLYPPGRILFVANGEKDATPALREVPAEFFQELTISHKSFDIAKHLPARYESSLMQLLACEVSKTNSSKQ